ncbi:hypothetical protein [Paucilactobacillus nenjiangensis]|uniref:Uncharacterized protein n=1 Tax=Paucilactobacillus nenjiangensis TaxID=1296540 RepID=A0A5P1X5L4_9LACO|nr:hypothetical protein [Paucilactobacillus nenjiangensis]QER67537.1 hypothetical protein F0161_06495 [Paucilactobacillus nenjiangensis]
MQTNNSNKGKQHKVVRGSIIVFCVLFILYLIIGYFGLTEAQKTAGFMFSWYGMFAVSLYVIVRCVYPKARFMNLFRINWFH